MREGERSARAPGRGGRRRRAMLVVCDAYLKECGGGGGGADCRNSQGEQLSLGSQARQQRPMMMVMPVPGFMDGFRRCLRRSSAGYNDVGCCVPSTALQRLHSHEIIQIYRIYNPHLPRIITSNHRPKSRSTHISHLTNIHTKTIMGWFGASSSQPSPPPPAPSQDGGFIAPDRSARAVCWEGRDSFFQCLDRNNIIDSVREDQKARNVCAPELKQFESACASSWVCYVDDAREFGGVGILFAD